MRSAVRQVGFYLFVLGTLSLWSRQRVSAIAIDCWADPVGAGATAENYVDVLYTAASIEDSTSNTGFMLLCNSTAFTSTGDYEDPRLTVNDIGMWSRDPLLFPRTFGNVDTTNPTVPDKAEAECQVAVGGSLKGKEIRVSFERGQEVHLPRAKNCAFSWTTAVRKKISPWTSAAGCSPVSAA